MGVTALCDKCMSQTRTLHTVKQCKILADDLCTVCLRLICMNLGIVDCKHLNAANDDVPIMMNKCWDAAMFICIGFCRTFYMYV